MSNPLGSQEELGFPRLCSRAFDTPADQQKGKLFLSRNYFAELADPIGNPFGL